MSRLRAYGLSDMGEVRENNEDVWLSLPEWGFFALADGMGGHKAGEIAAKETIESLSLSAKQIQAADTPELMTQIRYAIEEANQHVYRLSRSSKDYRGMGTTLCLLKWTSDAIIYAHVGDSRIYHLRDQKLKLLTQDHSFWAKLQQSGALAEEPRTPYPYKNVITRAIGGKSAANPEVACTTPEPGDLLFLCSDGLSDVLETEEMEEIILAASDIRNAAKKLIEKAKFKRSSDNMTVLIIESTRE